MLKRAETPATAAFRWLAGADPLVIGDIVLLEVLRGASSEARSEAIKAWLRSFTLVLMLGAASATRAAAHDRRLRELGITPSSTPDVIIASWCIAHAVPLLHQDRDFDLMAGPLGLPIHSLP
ncbi:PIN domain-containing protein [Siccirubricoccus sp. KC 17139]|uniref:Ribonuclease VapC n=1 Tax=Siccirubricoccus soli TaxID=2899147 RepID=A0ABT1D9U9_9PROT|nr:PIN domain-containing protein [Siccirubricoccus soli]MCP2684838.1 PIN domain-containing protein [Siccirubricoccus soli]